MVMMSDARDRLIRLMNEHALFLLTLVGGAFIWGLVFWRAASTFGGTPPFRAVWNGTGTLPIFGYTITFNFEGWVDYDYYYVNWADQFLHGVIPYTDEFNRTTIGGETYTTPYFFPPLYLYLCATGRLLPIQPAGIGFLLTFFGLLTAVPIYGIATYLSDDTMVGVLAATSYLFNPIVLYYTAFEWLNPAPFVFFGMLGLYLLMTDHRVSGALAITTSALFKQTAFFFGLPLIAYLIKRPPREDSSTTENADENYEGDDTDEEREEYDSTRPLGDQLDLRGFLKILAIIIAYAALLSMPYLLDPANYIFYIFVKPGITKIEDLTVPTEFTIPVTMVIPLIVFNAPMWLREFVNFITYSSIALIAGMSVFLILMLLEIKDDRNLREYWRRLFYLMFLLLLWVHLWSPRGIYKYYLVALVPFFTILSVSRMCARQKGHVQVSLWMMVLPILWSLAVLFTPRNLYILILAAMFLVYLLQSYIGHVWGRVVGAVRVRVVRSKVGS